jgi:hypothetical protein
VGVWSGDELNPILKRDGVFLFEMGKIKLLLYMIRQVRTTKEGD